ncbi:MAG: YggS family pyridoxal phosphate-dependent enzyme [Lentisphaeria bacterium]|nr:YggS family pyridoxal phosphate-dependent enzyme [Lentisphaeria bacterium]
MNSVCENFRRVRSEVDAAAAAAGRNGRDILLLAVSKTFPASDIRALYGMGVRDFGENRIQELETKSAELPQDIVWHFIGSLQSNKIRKAVKLASVIHSVDSVSAVERLDRIAEEEGRHVKFLLEVNVSGEASKSGVPKADFMALARAAAACRYAVFSGLMTMAPLDAPVEMLDAVFGGLAELRDRAEKELHVPLPLLSMGMSGDFVNAVSHGSTIVRIGTAIFGRR